MEIGRKKEGYGYLLKWFIGLGDLVVINTGLIFIYRIFLHANLDKSPLLQEKLGIIILLTTLTYFIVASIIPIRLSSNIIFFDKIVQRSISFISLYYILLSVGITIFHIIDYNIAEWLFFYISVSFIYTLWHIMLRSVVKLYRRKGYNYKRIVIIGESRKTLSIYNELKSNDYGYKILGFFNEKKEQENNELTYLGCLSDIETFCVENNVDEIYCTLSNDQEKLIMDLVSFAEKNMMRFYLVPEFYGYIGRKLSLSFLQSTPVITLTPEPLQLLHNRILKRSLDIVFSFVVLLTIFPLVFIILGFIIKITSRGPILFKQLRTGLKGEAFTCYKFRSMEINPLSDISTTTSQDSRITRIGRFMRRTSIDELPQFYNVLIGHMSLVGPRPHMILQTDLYEKLIDRFMIRHIVKPGITGWAQISGYRGETKTLEQMEGRFKRDIWYIENWSFVLDIKIIVVTAFLILKGDENAY